MREPSEDVRLAFGEGQMTRSGEVEPDRLVQRLSSLQHFLPLGTETGLQVAFKVRALISSYNKVERSALSWALTEDSALSVIPLLFLAAFLTGRLSSRF